MNYLYPDFKDTFSGELKIMGPKTKSQFGDMQSSDVVFPMAVAGSFKDKRRFSQNQIQEWVSSSWIKHQDIVVEKVGNIFLFYCSHIEDRDNLLSKRSACYQGFLVIFKSWFPSASIRSFDFSVAPLWIRVEGIPLTSNCPHVAR